MKQQIRQGRIVTGVFGIDVNTGLEYVLMYMSTMAALLQIRCGNGKPFAAFDRGLCHLLQGIRYLTHILTLWACEASEGTLTVSLYILVLRVFLISALPRSSNIVCLAPAVF